MVLQRKKILRDNIHGLTKPAIMRLCHKAGVKRVDSHIYEEIKGIAKYRMEDIIRDAIALSQYQEKKVVGDDEMLFAISKFQNLAYSEEYKNKISNCPI